jgi:hypothetical protein
MHRLQDVTGEAEAVALSRLESLAARLASTPLATICYETLDAVILATGADRGNLQLVNPASQVLGIVAQRGFDRDFLEFFARVHLHGSACAAALRDRRQVVVTNVRTDRHFDREARQVMLRGHAHAVQSTPLVTSGGTVLGVVSSHYAEPTIVSTRTLGLVARIARRAGALIERRGGTDGGHVPVSRFAAVIRERMAGGLLPLHRPSQPSTGPGSGEPCSVCEATIAPVQTEYGFAGTGRVHRFHVGCFRLWEVECRRQADPLRDVGLHRGR